MLGPWFGGGTDVLTTDVLSPRTFCRYGRFDTGRSDSPDVMWRTFCHRTFCHRTFCHMTFCRWIDSYVLDVGPEGLVPAQDERLRQIESCCLVLVLMLHDDCRALIRVGLVHICLHHPSVQPDNGLGQAMESYSHTTVPSRLSTMLSSPAAACTPEVRVIPSPFPPHSKIPTPRGFPELNVRLTKTTLQIRLTRSRTNSIIFLF